MATLRPLIRGAGDGQQADLVELLAWLSRRDLPWIDRLSVLRDSLLTQVPMLLVLDNFEDNLIDGEPADGLRAIGEELLADFLAAWLEDPGQAGVA